MTDSDHQLLIVYGHKMCAAARLLARQLEDEDIPYEWRDILRGDPAFQEQLKALAAGSLSVPTVVFPDGTALVEPAFPDVIKRLGGSSGLADRLRNLFG